MRLTGLLSTFALTTMISGAYAGDVNRLFVIGDSLSDGGAYSRTVSSIRPGPEDILYNFTTNPSDGSSATYADFLAQKLGVELRLNELTGSTFYGFDAVKVGGTNYAQGGARIAINSTSAENLATGFSEITLSEQVSRLLADNKSFNSDDLVILWGGANDILAQAVALNAGTSPQDALAEMAKAAKQLAGLIEQIQARGPAKIFVSTLPQLSQTPRGVNLGPANSAPLDLLGNHFNEVLRSELEGKNVLLSETGDMMTALLNDPQRFGFTVGNTGFACDLRDNEGLFCVEGRDEKTDERYIFADGIHPTDEANQLLGAYFFSQLRAAQQAGTVAIANVQRQRVLADDVERKAGLAAFDKEVGQLSLETSLSGGYLKTEEDGDLARSSGFNQRASVDVQALLSENILVGTSLTYAQGSLKFGGNAGGFDSRSYGGSAYGVLRVKEDFFLRAAAGGALIDLHSIERRAALSPTTLSYDSSTNGSYAFAQIGAGAEFDVTSEITLSPSASFTVERLQIDGYTEEGDVAPLRYGAVEYLSQRLRAGVSVDYTPEALDGFTLTAAGQVNHDFNEDAVSIPINLRSGGYEIARPAQTWGDVRLGVSKQFAGGSVLAASGGAALGLSGVQAYSGSLRYTLSF